MRALGGRLLLAGAAFVATLILVELVAPWVLPERCGRGEAPLWRPSRSVGWSLIPGATADHVVCASSKPVARHRIIINGEGHRDRPRDPARSRRPRALVLGDSLVEGLQVDLSETFTSLLEDRLGVDVIDAGVSGYSTDNELRAFDLEPRRAAPDVVLLVFNVGNDVVENGPRLFVSNPHGLPLKPWLRAHDAGRRLAACLALHRDMAILGDSTPDFLWRRSRIVRFALVPAAHAVVRAACGAALGPPLQDGVPELLGVYGPPATPAWTEAWDTTETLLVRLAERVRAAGARFGVALAPAGYEYDATIRVYEGLYPATRAISWDYDYPYARLGPILDRAGIPWMSLRPALEAHHRATGRSGYYSWDPHWTAEGHRVVAGALGPFVAALLDRGG